MMHKVLLVSLALGAVTLPRADTNPQPDTNPQGASGKEPKLKAVDEAADISGYYVCQGLEAGGKKYSGVTVINKKNEVYLVQWVIGSGSTFTGIGIRQGNTLAVSWALPGDKGGLVRGVNLYKIDSGPRLSGRWATIPGPGQMQSETLTFLKALETNED